MNASTEVIIVGSYVQDQAWFVERFPRPGETMRANRYNTGPGGKGFNQAVACARQGVPTLFIGAIGADAAGGGAQGLAAEEGIDARWQRRGDAATGSACIVVEGNGQNRIIVALGANERLDPSHLDAQAAQFADAQVLLLQLENNLDATRHALALATTHQLLRVLNPAPVHAGLDAGLLAQCDLLTPNESEFALLLERIAGERVDASTLAQQDDANLHRLARTLGTGSIIVTLGARGCFVSHAQASRHGDDAAFYRVAPEQVAAVDTTGAGDAFSGALVASIVRFAGRPLRDAVVHANRSAALSTEMHGAARSMPRFADVQQRFT
jgi:ribokinase